MWPFKRRQKPAKLNPVPEEIKAYYQAEKQAQGWRIWLLSIGTFFVTLAVVVLLFWGGRWTYRQIKGNSKPHSTTVSTDQTSSQSGSVKSGNDNGGSASTPTTSPSAPSSATQTPNPAATSAPSASPAPTTSNGQLIDTGPGNVDL
jgi:hypothetical protein